MAALLEISKLNEYDRANKSVQKTSNDLTLRTEENLNTIEPSPKRIKTDDQENKYYST